MSAWHGTRPVMAVLDELLSSWVAWKLYIKNPFMYISDCQVKDTLATTFCDV